jgi:hypothetical protein
MEEYSRGRSKLKVGEDGAEDSPGLPLNQNNKMKGKSLETKLEES